MKNYIYAILAFLLISCVVAQTESKPSKKTLGGNWEVTNIKFTGDSGLYKVDLFDLVDSDCFMGSEWVFIPENGEGKITILNSDSCENKIDKIQWSLYEPGDGTFQFQFKYVDVVDDQINNFNRGYRSGISQLSSNTMKMNVIANVNGKPFEVEMTFNKISEEINL